jgi:hypothetical protein
LIHVARSSMERRPTTRGAPRRGQLRAAIARSVVHAFASIVHRTRSGVSPAYLTMLAPWTSSDREKLVKILQSH